MLKRRLRKLLPFLTGRYSRHTPCGLVDRLSTRTIQSPRQPASWHTSNYPIPTGRLMPIRVLRDAPRIPRR